MAVYKRTYASYTGPLTPRWSRFLILTRYAARGLFRIANPDRPLYHFFHLSAVHDRALVYLNQNAHLLSHFEAFHRSASAFVDVNGKLFIGLMGLPGIASPF